MAGPQRTSPVLYLFVKLWHVAKQLNSLYIILLGYQMVFHSNPTCGTFGKVPITTSSGWPNPCEEIWVISEGSWRNTRLSDSHYINSFKLTSDCPFDVNTLHSHWTVVFIPLALAILYTMYYNVSQVAGSRLPAKQLKLHNNWTCWSRVIV